MAAPTLVQSINAASNAAGPATITPTFGAGSTAGNLLILAVAVAGTTVAITTPAGWTLLATQNFAGVGRLHLFMLPNNAGGITSVAVTITATAGSAVASMFEYSGFGTVVTNDDIRNNGLNPGQNIVLREGNAAVFTGELRFCAVAFNASTTLVSFNTSAGWSASVAGGTSTSGAPNLTIANFWQLVPGPGIEQVGVNLNASVLVMLILARFQALTGGNIFGGAGPGQVVEGIIGSPNGYGSWGVG
jgi:hypothetical protein